MNITIPQKSTNKAAADTVFDSSATDTSMAVIATSMLRGKNNV